MKFLFASVLIELNMNLLLFASMLVLAINVIQMDQIKTVRRLFCYLIDYPLTNHLVTARWAMFLLEKCQRSFWTQMYGRVWTICLFWISRHVRRCKLLEHVWPWQKRIKLRSRMSFLNKFQIRYLSNTVGVRRKKIEGFVCRDLLLSRNGIHFVS